MKKQLKEDYKDSEEDSKLRKQLQMTIMIKMKES